MQRAIVFKMQLFTIVYHFKHHFYSSSVSNCLILVIHWTLEIKYTGLDKIQRLVILCPSVSQEKINKKYNVQKMQFLIKPLVCVFSHSRVFPPILIQEIISKIDMNTWKFLHCSQCLELQLTIMIPETQVCPIL